VHFVVVDGFALQAPAVRRDHHSRTQKIFQLHEGLRPSISHVQIGGTFDPIGGQVSLTDWQAELNQLAYDSSGDPRIRVAVLDGPVDTSHPCFTGASLEQLEAPSQSPDLTAAAHGTSVASILFGQPGSLVRGIVPRCHGLLVPVLHQQGDTLGGSQVDLARGIALALQNGAAVINISAGQFEPGGEAHPYLADMVRRCEEQGVLLVAATGNDGCCCLHVPAAAGSVLAVGAMDEQGNPSPNSNWGEAYLDHGILAPGSNIPGAVPGGGTRLHKGTSWATAIVSGFAALLLSEQLQRGGTSDPLAIRSLLIETANGCDEHSTTDCRRFLSGRLNIARAWAQLATERRRIMSVEEQILEPPTNQLDPPRVQPQGQKPDCKCNQSAGEKSCSCSEKAADEGGCGSKKSQPSLVYALGQLAYDFGSEARRDSFIQRGLANPYDARQVLAYLQEHRALASSLTWMLVQDSTPIYAIIPAGAFAAEIYDALREFLRQQLEEGVERISVAGWSAGKMPLASGQSVPTLMPELRGMYSWSTAALLEAVVGKPDSTDDETREQVSELGNFLDRIYYELRNLGLLPQERAMNYAATNAFQLGDIYTRTARAGLKLDSITTEKSPLCRPDSDCWDVKLTFFHPTKRLEQSREIYRLTVDVSDVVPVTVGQVRRWHVY
jgi:hypothetical protein